MILREYQQRQVYEAAKSLIKNNAVLIQLPTGGGKTPEISFVANGFISKSNQRVLTLSHRFELLKQIEKTCLEWFNLKPQIITKETKAIYDKHLYSGMVKTIFRRLSTNSKYLPNIGLIIIDEAHRGEFRRIREFFPDALILAFTATALSSSRNDPLKNYYQDIIVGPQINELIQIGALTQNHTYSLPSVKRAKLKVVNGRFDERFMGEEFSKIKNVINTIDNYEKYSPYTKAICFNCNIEHSLVMTQAWKDAGYEARHVDGNTPAEDRRRIFEWFKRTDKAILNNVGIANAGLDIPDIFTVIPNKATKSLIEWLQECGRGSRLFDGKEYFTVLDMGGNARGDALGDWNQDRDWRNIFFNPPKPKDKLGAMPVKDCWKCGALIPMRSMECPYCGFFIPQAEQSYDTKKVELILVTKNIKVKEWVAKDAGSKKFYTLFRIMGNIVTQIKSKCNSITQAEVNLGLDTFLPLAEEYFKEIKKEFNQKAKDWCTKLFLTALKWKQQEPEQPVNHVSQVKPWI